MVKDKGMAAMNSLKYHNTLYITNEPTNSPLACYLQTAVPLESDRCTALRHDHSRQTPVSESVKQIRVGSLDGESNLFQGVFS